MPPIFYRDANIWPFLCPRAKTFKKDIFAKSIVITSLISRWFKCGAIEDAVRMCPLWRVLVSRTRVAGLAESLTLRREVDIRHVAVDDFWIVKREGKFEKIHVEPVSGFSSVILEPRTQMIWDSTPEDCRVENIDSQSVAVRIGFEELNAKRGGTGTDVDCINLAIVKSLSLRRTGSCRLNGANGLELG
jgi:hypothetical protein